MQPNDGGNVEEPHSETAKLNKQQPLETDFEQSNKGQGGFAIVAICFQLFLIIMYAIATEYPRGDLENVHLENYPYFQDVHVMVFIGFGFLMTYLRHYGYSAISVNFLLAAFSVQWGTFLCAEIDVIFGKDKHKMHITVPDIINGDFAAAAVLISFGAVLGRTSPVQLLVMAFIELILYAVNFYILYYLLWVQDLGGSMVIHTFGAFFGVSVAFVLEKFHKSPEPIEKGEESQYHSDLFSMIGTIFLWICWPSFNGALGLDNNEIGRAIVNTLISLSSCVVTTFALSRLFNRGKFTMDHIQNSTLAGGVAAGACANLYLHPSGAMGLGMVAATISVFGFAKVKKWLHSKGVPDTCGVLHLHGFPGILSGIASAIAIGAAHKRHFYPHLHYDSFRVQAGHQIAGILVTLGISILSGSITGLIISFFGNPKKTYVDEEDFVVADGYKSKSP